MEQIDLLTTLNEGYLPQLQVMLTSLAMNNPKETFALTLLHSGISEKKLQGVAKQCEAYGYSFFPTKVEDALFGKAPVTKQYPKEMYYRLLAPHLLPKHIKRVLYLDPDTLIINPIRPLWETDLQGNLFAAAAHTGKTELANSVDLERGQKEISPEQIFRYVEQHSKALILPDQDILNALYGEKTLPLEDAIWNYDARNYSSYLLRSGGVYDMQWVMQHTAILHFCGREKPWKPGYIHRFGILYQHYMQLARRAWQICL